MSGRGSTEYNPASLSPIKLLYVKKPMSKEQRHPKPSHTTPRSAEKTSQIPNRKTQVTRNLIAFHNALVLIFVQTTYHLPDLLRVLACPDFFAGILAMQDSGYF